jgi:hypothetical protein
VLGNVPRIDLPEVEFAQQVDAGSVVGERLDLDDAEELIV